MIGLLQYDFIAGIFGYQASVFSRIIYIVFGVACAFLVFKIFKNKGTLAVFSRRNKKDLAKNIAKMQHKDEVEPMQSSYSQANVESGKDYLENDVEKFQNLSRERHSQSHYNNFDQEKPRSLFDEHFDDER